MLGSVLLVMTSLSLFRVGTSDPGILPLYRAPEEKCVDPEQPSAFAPPTRDCIARIW